MAGSVETLQDFLCRLRREALKAQITPVFPFLHIPARLLREFESLPVPPLLETDIPQH